MPLLPSRWPLRRRDELPIRLASASARCGSRLRHIGGSPEDAGHIDVYRLRADQMEDIFIPRTCRSLITARLGGYLRRERWSSIISRRASDVMTQASSRGWRHDAARRGAISGAERGAYERSRPAAVPSLPPFSREAHEMTPWPSGQQAYRCDGMPRRLRLQVRGLAESFGPSAGATRYGRAAAAPLSAIMLIRYCSRRRARFGRGRAMGALRRGDVIYRHHKVTCLGADDKSARLPGEGRLSAGGAEDF